MHGIYLPTHVNIPYMDPIGYSIDYGMEVTLPIFVVEPKNHQKPVQGPWMQAKWKMFIQDSPRISGT